MINEGSFLCYLSIIHTSIQKKNILLYFPVQIFYDPGKAQQLNTFKAQKKGNTTDSKDQNLAQTRKSNGFLCRSNDVAKMLTSCQGEKQHCLPHCQERAPAVLYHQPPNKPSYCDLGRRCISLDISLGCLFITTFLLINFIWKQRGVTASPSDLQTHD